MEYLIIIIIAYIAYKLFIVIKSKKGKNNISKEKIDEQRDKDYPDYMPYQKKKFFLSKAENNFYKVLRAALKDTEYYISIKAKLIDFITVTKHPERQKFFNKIKSKHVDFLICNNDKYFNPILAIELDDKSHESGERKERDEFVDAVFRNAGLPIIHMKASNTYNLNEIRKEIAEKLNIETSTLKKTGEVNEE